MKIGIKTIGFVIVVAITSTSSWAYRQQDSRYDQEEILIPGSPREDWRPHGRGPISNDSFHGRRGPGQYQNPQPQIAPQTVVIQQAFRDEEIFLGRLFGLRDWAGYQLNYVSVRLRNPMPRRQSFDLYINRNLVMNRIPSRGYSDINFALSDRNQIGRDIRQLSLGINGYAEIESVTLYLGAPLR